MAVEELNVVLSACAIALPDADTSQPLELRVQTDGADQPLAVATLTVNGTSAVADSVLSFRRNAIGEARLEVRQRGGAPAEEDAGDGCLFKSVSLEELGLGVGVSGTNGALDGAALEGVGAAPPAEADPKAKKGAAPPPEAPQAEFSCVWRIQRALPSMREHKCPPLALKYTATSSREAHCDRERAWREEMAHLDVIPGTPAPTPKHFLGDASSRRLRAAYSEDRAQMQTAFSAQATAMKTQRLQERCLTCLTAVEASDALTMVKQFIMQGTNLSQVNAEE